jgi:hypothetical protein|nr:MAG TPA: Protein of unknown function (DUF1617) [Caudoviricetes sp.]
MATKNITLTNLEIYTTAQALMENITTDMNLPVKVGFYIQKNMKKMTELAQEIEKSRMEIFDKYGEKDEENNQYKFDKSVQEQVQKELNDLFDLTQDVKTNMLELDWFDDIDLNANQIAAISYMIADDDEDEVEE